ncbi:nodulation protein NfeD [Bacteroidota bacterium]
MKKSYLTISILILFSIQLFASDTNEVAIDSSRTFLIYKFDIKEEIAPPVVRKAESAFEAAKELNADLVVIHMNTFGGLLDAADKLRTMILESEITTYVFIDNNAASAGALISIACDSIYMNSGSSIGAATVVNQTGEAMPDKYQSYMRSMMRSTAESQGRDPDIAQAMVDPRIKIEGIIDSGQVLTFTTSEAIKHGFCEGEVNDIEELLEHAGIKNYELKEQKLTAMDKFIGFLINPYVNGILIMIMLGGIYFELQSPGIGFPLAAAVVAALLFFAPLYMEGLAAHWEILLFIIGVILIMVEIFAIPGFGVAGVSGIILIVVALTLSMVGNFGFDFHFVNGRDIAKAFFIVVIASFFSLVLSILIGQRIFTTNIFGNLALNTVQNANEGYTSSDNQLKTLIGKKGIAVTILRPAGNVEINGDIYNATAETGYIEKGEEILVVKHETTSLFVRKA